MYLFDSENDKLLKIFENLNKIVYYNNNIILLDDIYDNWTWIKKWKRRIKLTEITKW